MTTIRRRLSKKRNGEERGAALVEFAIAIPLFIALIALIFDAGLGYAAARSTSSAARSAARVGALAGESRNADFLILDALSQQFGNGDSIQRVVIYVSDPLNPANPADPGAVPDDCTTSQPGICNVYEGSIFNGLDASLFTTEDIVDLAGNVIGEKCADTAPDAAWCPLNRRINNGSFLGVHVEATQTSAVGLGTSEFGIEDRAVFAMFFPALPSATSTATN